MIESHARDSKVDWNPIRPAGATFAVCKLRKVSDARLELIPTKGFIVFALIFLLGGLAVVIRVIFYPVDNEESFYIALAVGSLFALTGGWLLFVSKNSVVFVKLHDKWRISKNNIFAKAVKFFPDKPFYAFQVLEKHDDGSTSYELNIVYEDGSRENVLNQADGALILKITTTLAESLNIPFLNGLEESKYT